MDTEGFSLDFGLDKGRWKRLLDEINDGNVIPVIGPDLLVDPVISQDKDGMQIKENLHQQLISYIASQTKVKTHPRTFSQLVYDEDYKRCVRNDKQIYSLLHQITSNFAYIPTINSKPSQLLKDLLSTKRFPFVITTSFTPIVENAMREVWGDVKVLNFDNDPHNSCSWERGGDIRTPGELKDPTVYYMFGKVCDDTKNARFVVKDSDMMDFCSSWIKGDGVPKTLTDSLKNKYLLILGNNYSDWLFRFVWYSLRSSSDVLESNMKSDIVVKDNAEESFKQFLDRLETFFQENPEEVVRRIKEEMETRKPKQTQRAALYDTDIFISYSRSDKTVAKNLYDKLKGAGFSVWFDDYSIPRGADWEAQIKSGVNKTRLFVPILSHNVEKESIVPHEYRTEWTLAAHVAARIGGRKFVIPFAETGFNFYDQLTKLPQEFMEKNATWYTNDTDLDEICEVLKQSLEEVKKLEEKYTNS